MGVLFCILTWVAGGFTLIAFLFLVCRYHKELDEAFEWFYELCQKGKQ